MTGQEEVVSDRRHPELEMASREEGKGELMDRGVERSVGIEWSCRVLKQQPRGLVTFGRLRLSGVNTVGPLL